MKNRIKLFGIIALAAVIGLGLAGCDNGNGGEGNEAIIIINNQSEASIQVDLEDAWESVSGSEISSGLETKTISANTEQSWSLSCTGDRAWVNIKIDGTTRWSLYDVGVGETCKFIWNGSKLTESQ
jgi:hypothetical protein